MEFTKLEMLDILGGRVCVCLSTKYGMKSHCRTCFFSLPTALQSRLYQKFGQGYEAAFTESVNHLIESGRVQKETARMAIRKPARRPL